MDDPIEDAGIPPRRPLVPGPSRASTTSNTANPDRASAATAPRTGVVQPKPQALPKRSGPSSIIVSPRQKGNPILNNIKSLPWEYGDIPADYVLGLTTCALFLSLKYHRLHPEYIYTRIRQLAGKYLLRIVLVMVDITNHEESLRELHKTSLINNVTLILCWSSAEGGRYLELFKQYENAAPTAIKQHQSNAYADRMIDFITTPRSVNKTDAVSLVSQFGTVRTAVNARHEDIAGIAGWGEKKVQRWCASVREPFRVQRTAKRGITRENTTASGSRAVSESRDEEASPSLGERIGLGKSPLRQSTPPVPRPGSSAADADQRPRSRLAEEVPLDTIAFDADEETMDEMMAASRSKATEPSEPSRRKRKPDEDADLSDGIMAALSRLRKDGG